MLCCVLLCCVVLCCVVLCCVVLCCVILILNIIYYNGIISRNMLSDMRKYISKYEEIYTRSAATGRRIWGLNPSRRKKVFCSPKRPERLWNPPSLLLNGYRGSFWDKTAGE